MKTEKTIKSLALAILGGLLAVGAAFADVVNETGESTVSNVASEWKLENNYLVEVLSEADTQNGVTAWTLPFSGGSISVNGNSPSSGITIGTHTDLDFSMLDGSEGSACKVTGIKLTNLSITSVKWPSTVTSLDAWAFQNCALTNSCDFSNMTSIGASVFRTGPKIQGEVYAPVLTSLGVYAFSSTDITRVEMPMVTAIGANTFDSCSSLATVVLPSVTSIGEYAFSGCSALTDVVVPSVTTLGQCAFRSVRGPLKLPWCMGEFKENINIFSLYNQSRSSIHLFVHNASLLAKQGATTIADRGWSNSENITFYGGKVEKDGVEWVYDDTVWNEENKNYDFSSDSVTIVAAPDAKGTATKPLEIPKKLNNATVTAIEACAFKNNEGLTCVTVPKTVTRIGVAAFPKGCYIKVKAGDHAQALVDQLNAEYGTDETTKKPYASIDYGGGLMIIVK